MDLLSSLRGRVADAVSALGIDDPSPFAAMVKPAQDPKFGDFQANAAMPLAKRLGRPPRDVAAEIVAGLDVADLCDPPEIAGPGFINFRVSDAALVARTTHLLGDERLGVATVTEPLDFVIDFSSPNVAKPMHVGHLRSTVIGDALQRLARFVGHRVTSDNHIGDWGTQFGMIICGYRKFLDGDAYGVDAVTELARLYRLVSKISGFHETRAAIPGLRTRVENGREALAALEAETDPKDKAAKKKLGRERDQAAKLARELRDAEQTVADADAEFLALAEAHPDLAREAREETAKLHAGDAENRRLWDEFMPACLAALNRVYDRLGVTFDETLGESHYQPRLAGVVDDLAAKGLAEDSDGATVVFTAGHDAPFIVRKRDGAFLYATTDLATIKDRVDRLGVSAIDYVVDKRQSQHFEQLFATAERWGYGDVSLRHVSFGTVLGEDRRPFKTRSGDTVGLESLLDEAVAKAREIVAANDDAKPVGPELDDAGRDRVAEAVGIGGIKYADLKHNRDSDYVFSFEKMLATNGDTATYMQYAHARVRGIMRKAGDEALPADAVADLPDPAERALALQLDRFGDAVHAASREARPNYLTEYLFETAGRFSEFYDRCPVLKADSDTARRRRLALCGLTARVIGQGLDLLGIDCPDRM